VGVRLDFDQLGRDPHPVTGHPHRALQYMFHAQLLGDFGDGGIRAFECKGRGARRNPQTLDLGEHIEQLF
jgi:hypothetical protein